MLLALVQRWKWSSATATGEPSVTESSSRNRFSSIDPRGLKSGFQLVYISPPITLQYLSIFIILKGSSLRSPSAYPTTTYNIEHDGLLQVQVRTKTMNVLSCHTADIRPSNKFHSIVVNMNSTDDLPIAISYSWPRYSP